MESIIRLFVCADLFEIEGLVATTGWSSGGNNAAWIKLIHDAINAYEKDLPNPLAEPTRACGKSENPP